MIHLVKVIFNNNNINNNNNNDNNVSLNKDENDNENDNESANDDDDYYIIKQLNNYFKTIDETKSFKEQIETLKTKDFLDESWHLRYCHGNKELNHKILKAKAAHILNDADEQLFEKIFGRTFAALGK